MAAARAGLSPPTRVARGGARSSLASVLPETELSLIDLANRLLDRGVVLAGEAGISVGGVDLVYLGLNAVLSSVETLQQTGNGSVARGLLARSDDDAGGLPRVGPPGSGLPGDRLNPSQAESRTTAGLGLGTLDFGPGSDAPAGVVAASTMGQDPFVSSQRAQPEPLGTAPLAAAEAELERLRGVLPERVDVDPDGVEQGLAKLVLTLVEFIRQLLERQAIRRMEGGSLSEEQVERMGLALQRLEAKMADLCRVFGLNPDELNINLGPLGDLL